MLKYIITVYLILFNLIGFFIMLIDKKKAEKHKWRIKESTLLLVSAFGGSIGMLLGMKTFRHKTKHKKFTIGVPAILIIQIVLSLCLLY